MALQVVRSTARRLALALILLPALAISLAPPALASAGPWVYADVERGTAVRPFGETTYIAEIYGQGFTVGGWVEGAIYVDGALSGTFSVPADDLDGTWCTGNDATPLTMDGSFCGIQFGSSHCSAVVEVVVVDVATKRAATTTFWHQGC